MSNVVCDMSCGLQKVARTRQMHGLQMAIGGQGLDGAWREDLLGSSLNQMMTNSTVIYPSWLLLSS